MGKLFEAITPEQQRLIEASPLFFVGSVAPDLSHGPDGQGPLNLSPKGGRLHVIDPRRVAYLDYPGSGDETARHAHAGGPVTVMVMATGAADAAIVRLYGRAFARPLDDSPLCRRLLDAPLEHLAKRPRQVIEVAVARTQTSCGYGVPVLEHRGERTARQRGRAYKA